MASGTLHGDRSALSGGMLCHLGVVAALTAMLVAIAPGKALAGLFYLERPRLGALLEYSFRESAQTTHAYRSQGTSHRYAEGLSLASRGFVYHPALLAFSLTLEPTWEQQRERYDPGWDTSRRSLFLDYGFDGTLFQQRSLSLQLKARQATATGISSLSPTTTSENRGYGATLVYKSPRFPTILSYLANDQKQEGFYASTESTDTLRLSSSHGSKRYKSTLNADYEQRRREYQGLSQPMESASLRLRNDAKVTADGGMQLASSLTTRWLEVQDQANSNLDLSEILRWRHTQAKQRLQINSDYSARYTANRRNGEGSETIPLSANLSLSHLLYENLLSSLSGHTGYTRFEEGHESSYGGLLNFDYSRRVPKGLIRLTLGHAYQVRDRISTADEIAVFDEQLALDDFAITLLANRHVDLNSIAVFNSDKSVQYLRGFDYTISEVGDFVRIARVPLGGAIANGEMVQVSYTFRNDPSAKLGTLTRTFGAGISLWSALDLRYNLSTVREKLLDGIPPETLSDDLTQSVTAQLDYHWSTTLLAYDDEQRAAGNSRRRWRATQSFNVRPRGNLFLALKGIYGESELLDTNVEERAYELRATGQWQPRPNHEWRLEAFRNQVVSTLPDRIESSGYALFYLLRYLIWSVKVDYRHLLDRQPLVGQERTSDTVNLTLQRELY